MTTAIRLLSLVVAIALVSPVVLAPLPAAAQSETQMAPAQATQQPDLYQEALRASQAAPREYEGAYTLGAGVASAFSVPGRAILCGAGTALSLVTLALTFGSGYGAAKSIFEEGCVGKWIVTPDDLRAENQRRGMRPDSYVFPKQ